MEMLIASWCLLIPQSQHPVPQINNINEILIAKVDVKVDLNLARGRL